MSTSGHRIITLLDVDHPQRLFAFHWVEPRSFGTVTDELVSEPDESETSSTESTTSTPRRRLPAWMTGIATLLVVVSIFSTWVQVQALDTDTWVKLSDELLQEEEVQEALSVFVVDALYEEVDLAGAIEDGLPEDLEGLAGPLSAALRGPATTAVEGLLASEQFRTAWLEANRLTHQTLIDVLRDETGPALSTGDGTVVLELGELIRVVGEKLGLSDDVLDRLPDDAGQIVIFESEELEAAQNAVKVLDFISWFTLFVVIALYAGAIYLAAGHRLRALRNVGFSLIAGGIVALVLNALATRLAVGALVENPARRSVADAVAQIGTGLIREMASSAIIYGLLVLGCASLLGDHRWARAVRDVIAPVFTASTAVIVASSIGVVLVLLWWNPGGAFDRWLTALAFVALVVGTVITLGRLVTSELSTADIDGESIEAPRASAP